MLGGGLFLISVWDITWMGGQVHALGQVDGCTWTSDSHAPGQVPSPNDHLVKCHLIRIVSFILDC